jgi:hypothetical protein
VSARCPFGSEAGVASQLTASVRKRGNMSEHEVVANQQTILHNQDTIQENQKTILHNQGRIEKKSEVA